jgi:hypothetical protein
VPLPGLEFPIHEHPPVGDFLIADPQDPDHHVVLAARRAIALAIGHKLIGRRNHT